ncbi:MAG: hypothetical protein OEQ39_25965 [Gammaproteobacteria bacterium]|nr:hypothetical protein [Gammaproteobacteria bacterium]MDH3466662.1 hypothetical protein [Gammaproteobacteria bacterium]
MLYLAIEIFVSLMAAALLGGIVGWILRGRYNARAGARLQRSARAPRRAVVEAEPISNTMALDDDTAPMATVHDDLKKIHGIDHKLERALNELGITSYEQITRLKEDDIERLAKAIGSFPDRIHRDDWIGGARREYMVKYRHSIRFN